MKAKDAIRRFLGTKKRDVGQEVSRGHRPDTALFQGQGPSPSEIAIADDMVIEERMMGGFFAPGDYVGIHKTDVYEEDGVSLDRFLVIEPGDSWQIYNWVQYYTPESAAAELGEAGFMVNILTGGLDGEPLMEDSKTIGVIAEKAGE